MTYYVQPVTIRTQAGRAGVGAQSRADAPGTHCPARLVARDLARVPVALCAVRPTRLRTPSHLERITRSLWMIIIRLCGLKNRHGLASGLAAAAPAARRSLTRSVNLNFNLRQVGLALLLAGDEFELGVDRAITVTVESDCLD